MTDLSALRTGQIILISDGRQATIRYVGHAAFAPGEWVGIELEDASGKNDGSVKGERYFDCDMGHGMFLRPSAVTEIIEQPRPPPPKANGKPTNGTSAKARPSSGIVVGANKRQSLLGTAPGSKRMSMASGSPTIGPRGAAAGRGTVRVSVRTDDLCSILMIITVADQVSYETNDFGYILR
jgi:dynactin 1